jgi:hypothetical protein
MIGFEDLPKSEQTTSCVMLQNSRHDWDCDVSDIAANSLHFSLSILNS